jgi:Cu(I)/Ag(I) efflux system membrane protein CusA/SilA
VPTLQRLGTEFMPPLDEGALTRDADDVPGHRHREARRVLTRQDRIIMQFPKSRPCTARRSRGDGDRSGAIDMIESVIALRPRDDWPTRFTPRWYSGTRPTGRSARCCGLWPEQQARTLAELSRDLDAALQMPGYQMAIAPPIRTRIDMLSTGVRTPWESKCSART